MPSVKKRERLQKIKSRDERAYDFLQIKASQLSLKPPPKQIHYQIDDYLDIGTRSDSGLNVQQLALFLLAWSAIREGTAPLSFASLLHDELVGDVRGVVLQVDRRDVLGRCFDLGPTIDLNTHVLLHNIGVCVADANNGTLAHNIELLIESHHLDAAVLVTNDAFSDAVEVTAIITATLADHLDRVDTKVHVNARSRLELAHGNKDGLAKGAGRLSLCFNHYCESA